MNDRTKECPTCGYEYPEGSVSESKKPLIASILMSISAIVGIAFALMLLLGYWDVSTLINQAQQQVGEDIESSLELAKMVFNICGITLLIISVVELTGATFSYKKRNWEIAVIGCIAGIFLISIFFISIS